MKVKFGTFIYFKSYGRMVVLIPLAIILIFFGYNIYSENFSNKPERIAMDDGTVRLHRNAGIIKFHIFHKQIKIY